MPIGERISFWNFIKNIAISKIEIPEIQRDYVQSRDSEKIRFSLERLLNDIHNAIFLSGYLDLNYIYGKIKSDKVFLPVDGQQRLTTLLTLHIYAFAMDEKTAELTVLKDKFSYKTRITTERFLVALIDNIIPFFKQDVMGIREYITDAAWFVSSWLRDPSIESFLLVLDKIERIFKRNTFASRLLSDTCPITFMGLSIDNMGNENDLYIKMNSRGKPLTEFEIFKSEMFDYIDDKIKDNTIDREYGEKYKVKADTAWMNMIWSTCTTPENECDKRYLKLIHHIILNCILPSTSGKYDEKLMKIIYNRGFYNFLNYRQVMHNDSIIHKIYGTFEFLEWLRQNDSVLLKSVLSSITSYGRKEQVRLFSITKYANRKLNAWTLDSFKAWYRIIDNLIKNTEIDKDEKYCSACQAIDKLSNECLQDAINYFSELSYNKANIGFFDSIQVKEEIIKAKLIKSNNAWSEQIFSAEKIDYFDCQIGFMFNLQNIDETHIKMSQSDINEFARNRGMIKTLFDKVLSDKRVENLFRRALLTFGDYSIIANSNNTFFFEGGNQYYNWRRMLREEKSFMIFKRMFDRLKAIDFADLETILREFVDEYNSDNEFEYNLVKVPQLFDYMRENRFKKDTESGHQRTIIYKKARLSAEYAEAMTFALYKLLENERNIVEYKFGTGYLGTDTSLAFISKINGQNIEIIFDDGFWLNGKRMEKNGNKIVCVKDALEIVKNLITTMPESAQKP